MGARPMERLIQEKIKLPLSKEILFSKVSKTGKKLIIDLKDDVIVIKAQEKTLA
jgi:ATP-dependent Clp protease ATP-binding subunit ClpA